VDQRDEILNPKGEEVGARRMFTSLPKQLAASQSLRRMLMLSWGLLSFPALAFGQGGPPLLTDDPGTPGNRKWEINLAFTTEHRRGERTSEIPLLDVNYGWGERIQLKFEVPWLNLGQEGMQTKSGLGNSLVGVKWRFLDEDKHGVSLSTYPQLEFNNPGSSAERGLVERGNRLLLPLEVQRRVGPVELNGEVGYELVEDGRDEWTMGLALGREVSPRLELLGEVHPSGQLGGGDHQIVFDVGGRWKLNKHYILLFAAGRSFRGPASGEPQFFAYAGLQFNFGM